MEDIKPRFFVSHDSNGLAIWLSKRRPNMNAISSIWKSKEGIKMRIPYSWFGHMLRENSIVEIDIETAVLNTVKKKAKCIGEGKST